MYLKGYSIRGAAKINLSLDVLGKRPNGYHDLSMIMQSVSLYDRITVFPTVEGAIDVISGTRYAPNGPGNTVYKAAQLIKDTYGIKQGVEITVEKRIPVAAGLAGGSSDGAGTLKLLNRLWDLRLTPSELADLGLKIGADVPFCLMNGTCLAEGVGEILTPLPFLKGMKVLLCKPPIPVSTAEVFGGYENEKVTMRPDNKKLIDFIQARNIESLAKNMANVLESVTIRLHPQIQEIKNEMLECGAIGTMMSGSGPTVFGIFLEDEVIQKAKVRLRRKYRETYITETVDSAWANYIKNIRR